MRRPYNQSFSSSIRLDNMRKLPFFFFIAFNLLAFEVLAEAKVFLVAYRISEVKKYKEFVKKSVGFDKLRKPRW